MATFNFKIITPLKIVLEKEVERVILRTIEGDMGILPNHAPFVAELAIGEMKIKSTSEELKFFVAGGFLEIKDNNVVILADDAMDAKDIDIEQAKKEVEIAKAKLVKLKEDRDIAVTQRALEASLTKVKIAENLK
ncbi:ATP synthase F1 subcomplex epsilon subunit [Hypnocyclicus thermotrophus]|uniref:ATP synthase epsilon chain n=1 Tax=Hypnocyclicus thermotrophus TaxID=1627895 RepID=A0AA46DYQ2_9FUSO|nr:ATP synthase F1 subunit epsilon [Hypnocyclicus thermotrophus]TDT70533.1 ATP synthase F1 subcomplex epsilon subunit [Hypnocyclicus thermotrophus]